MFWGEAEFYEAREVADQEHESVPDETDPRQSDELSAQLKGRCDGPGTWCGGVSRHGGRSEICGCCVQAFGIRQDFLV